MYRATRNRWALLALPATLALVWGCSDAAGPPPPPAEIQPVVGDGQSARVGEDVPVPPVVEVRDSRGQPSAGVVVTFTVSGGGGSLVGPVDTTDARGRAGVERWTLGTSAGRNTLTATTSGGLTTTITATATAGAPVRLEKVAGDEQTAPVGSAVPVAPAVVARDRFGNRVPGATVNFSVSEGGGSVTGSTATTDSAGVARVGAWTLGRAAGTNRLVAALPDGTSVSFTATGVPGAPAALEKVQGDDLVLPAGANVAPRPTVKVVDAFGNGIEGVTVTFTVTQGSGSVTGATQVTDRDGFATVGSWRLGDEVGTQALRASAQGVAPVTFTVTATAAAYHIDVRYVNTPTAPQRAAMDAAVARWQEIIVGDLQDVSLSVDANACGPAEFKHPAINEVVDDLVVFVDFGGIDGPGGVLGFAGFCRFRTASGLPALGIMKLDSADLAAMERNGTLTDVIIHELGHVLGISADGWNLHNLLNGQGSSDPFFRGEDAIAAFRAAGGSHPHGVPVENCIETNCPGGGAGTRDHHWRESVLGTELMTGFVSAPGVPNPLSAITIASLQDMGYVVDFSTADPFTLGTAAAMAAPGQTVELIELPLPPPLPVGAR